jgi:protein-L-isoaspartate(D-aspartate) O-methyltransferase
MFIWRLPKMCADRLSLASGTLIAAAILLGSGCQDMREDTERDVSPGVSSPEPATESAPAQRTASADPADKPSHLAAANQRLAEILAEESPEFTRQRAVMVSSQLRARGISDERVLQAMSRVPRHLFVSQSLAEVAYEDCPQRIGHGQTISQPYIVALMTELAHVNPDSRVLDVGTGSGYQAAVLAEICREVYSIEIVPALATEAREHLAKLGYDHIVTRTGDGYRGWSENAPFDAIIVAAAPNHVPPSLVEQLATGGRLVIPIGEYAQELLVVEKGPAGATRTWTVAPVAFVPMTGEAQRPTRP